eukprot:jgi/Bigna1/76107/fgenesh1_pg.39_\
MFLRVLTALWVLGGIFGGEFRRNPASRLRWYRIVRMRGGALEHAESLNHRFSKLSVHEKQAQIEEDNEILLREGSRSLNYSKWEHIARNISNSDDETPSDPEQVVGDLHEPTERELAVVQGHWYSREAHPQHALPIIQGRRVSWGRVPGVVPAFMGKTPDGIYKSDSKQTLWFNGYFLDKKASNLSHLVWRCKDSQVTWLKRRVIRYIKDRNVGRKSYFEKALNLTTDILKNRAAGGEDDKHTAAPSRDSGAFDNQARN